MKTILIILLVTQSILLFATLADLIYAIRAYRRLK